jgi:hypothetical protein
MTEPFLMPLPFALLCILGAIVGLIFTGLGYKEGGLDWVEGGLASILCGLVGWAGVDALIRLITS